VRNVLGLLALPCCLCLSAAGAELAPGVQVIPGRFVKGEQPDGTTVVLRAPAGLIVVDTGRHPEHTQKILDLARALNAPIVAVINTHWHLDHVGGNPRLRRAYPGLKILASRAIEQAATGFLADYRKQLETALALSKDPTQRGRFQDEIAIIDAGPLLMPDQPISAAGSVEIGGRAFHLGLEPPAVTAGDVWLLDPKSRVLIAGDLVTLPVPLFDTACPGGWQRALNSLAAADFKTLVPGHGAPMSRADFDTYRAGFDHLLTCGASSQPAQTCIAGWLRDLGPLVPAKEREFARAMLAYYLTNHLRVAPGASARWCEPLPTLPPV
jgi:glyoxylase-like metal-dependent hydrolase (beta-lactamase superfamily II)